MSVCHCVTWTGRTFQVVRVSLCCLNRPDISWCPCVTVMILWCDIVIRWCCDAMILRYCTVVMWCCDTAMLWCDSVCIVCACSWFYEEVLLRTSYKFTLEVGKPQSSRWQPSIITHLNIIFSTPTNWNEIMWLPASKCYCTDDSAQTSSALH